MPNFQGAVNEVINQAGLYSSLAGGPQDLKERIRLGKEEKVVDKQLQNVGRDIADAGKRVKEAKASGDYSYARELSKRVKEQGQELSRLAESSLGIRERQYQLNPTKENYDAVMTARTRMSTIKEMDSLREKQELAMNRMREQAQAKKTQKDSMRKYIEELPTDLGGKVKDLDPTLREQIISKYMEANDGKQE